MRIEVRLTIIALLILAFSVLPAQAQYSEIYRLDKAVNGLDEKVVFAKLSERLSIPADTLAQQKTQYNLSFGQLYMANALAKATNKDFDTLMSQIKSGKTWSLLVQENNVRMQPIDGTVRDLEKVFKNERGSSNAKGSRLSTNKSKDKSTSGN
jgi:hypothetical protein